MPAYIHITACRSILAILFSFYSYMTERKNFMNIITCDKAYLTKMISMPSGSLAQNQALADSIAHGKIALTDCYLLLEHKEVKAHAVIMKEIAYIGYLTIEAITVKELQIFLQEIQKQLNPKQNWFCDVYSDKKYFPIIQQVLRQCFAICKNVKAIPFQPMQ